MGEVPIPASESDPPSALRPIGRYQPIAVLGAGGMASVYLALMRGRSKFSKLVVLKMPHREVAEDPALRAMFLDEARIAARINHPNIVQTYEIAEEDGRDIIVMEYLDGQTLDEILSRAAKKGTPIPLGMHVRIVMEAARGLHAAHELKDYNGAPLGLVHRDVSPHNVFVTFDGNVKVLDFGVAKAALSSHKTEAGTFKGKVRYMPREQLMGAESVDRRADIFALGVCLWEVATGSKLWKGTPEPEVMMNVAAGSIPGPRDVNPDADPRLDAIIRKAMASDPANRYATCLELEAELERFLEAHTEKFTLRDTGRYIGDLFAEVRARRVTVIEAQIARAEAMDPSPNSGVSGVMDVGTLPSASLARVSLTEEGSAQSIVGRPNSSATGQIPAAKSKTPIVLGIGVVLVAAVAALLVRSKSGPVAQPVEVASPSVAAAAASPLAPTTMPSSAEVKLALSAKPSGAKLKLDDQELPGNPVEWSVKRDGASHVLRVEAKGFQTKIIEVRYDGDKEVAVSLDAEASAAPAAHGYWAPPARQTPAPTPTKTTANEPEVKPAPVASPPAPANTKPTSGGPKRPQRPIDDSL